MTPIGYSARIPPAGTGNSLADINSDIAFKGNLAFQGHWSGFRVIDISDPTNPTQIYNTEACRHTSGQGDVVVHGNILVRTWDSASNDRAEREPDVHGPGDRPRLRGHPHLGHLQSRPRPCTSASCGCRRPATTPGAPASAAARTPRPACRTTRAATSTCTSAARAAPARASTSSGSRSPTRWTRCTCAASAHGRGASCHDNNVLMNVGGTKVGYAMCAGGNGLAMYKFDMAKPAAEAGTPASPGGVENPTLIWAKRMPDDDDPAVTTGHSGSFTYDGKLLVYGHEPGGGTQASCEASDSILKFRSLFFVDPETGDDQGLVRAAAAAVRHRELHVAQLQRRADVQGLLRRLRQLRDGHLGVRLLEPRRPSQQIAYADPAEYTPGATNTQPTAGNWSTHFYNGRIYESDIRRGVLIWNLDHDAMRRVRQVDLSNPQTQTTSFAQDLEGAAITISPAGRGRAVQAGRRADGQLLLHGLRLRRRVVRRPGGQRRRAGHEQDRRARVQGHGDRQGRQRHDQVGHLHGQQRRLPGRRERQRAGHALAQPRRGAELRRVRAGRRARVHGDRRRQRDLDRRERDAERRRPEHDEHGQARQRRASRSPTR